jgi:hypothetical protein
VPVDGVQAQKIPPNSRNGVGNYEIKRPNYIATSIVPRQHTDFDKLQAMDIATMGQKVQLSDKTIKKLLMVDIPDPTDLSWIAERDRLIAQYQARGMSPAEIERELKVNKPLNREQRTTKTSRNIGQATLSMGQKLDKLQREVQEGRAESRVQQAQIIGQFALVLADTNAISALTQLQLTNLGEALARVGVPTTHKRLGIIPRFVDINFYLNNAGLINLLFFSKVRETPNTILYNYDKIVKNFVADPINGLPDPPGARGARRGAIRLTSAISALGRRGGRRIYFDLDRGGVISREQLRNFAAANPGGFAGEDFAIRPEHQ